MYLINLSAMTMVSLKKMDKRLKGYTALGVVLSVLSGIHGAQAQNTPDDAMLRAPVLEQEDAQGVVQSSQPVLAVTNTPLKAQAEQAEEPLSTSNAPVDLQADSMQHDKAESKVVATGNVIMQQLGRTVRADQIEYYTKKDVVIATGNVEFTDDNGDKHYADRIQFSNSLKNGFVQDLRSDLVDGSHFTAQTGENEDGNVTVMSDATYTPCESCKDNPNKAPLWQIRASDVTHNKEDKTISYHNARFEVKGVPVAYVPYFSHPDGTEKRKSGFLTPSLGYQSETGGFVEESYYWSLAQDKDLTVGVRAMTLENPLILSQWRQRWDRAQVIADASFTYSGRADSINGVTVQKKDELRGNLRVDGLWNMNELWRSGVKLNLASDDQYLRQYNLDSEDVLENEVYAERFKGRNYSAIRMLAFQDTRIEEDRDDQPNILPEIETSFLGEPNSVPLIGGRWSADASMLGLVRGGSEQDMNRFSAAVGWQRRLISSLGLLTTLSAKLRGDFYDIGDSYATGLNSNVDGNTTQGRGFGYVNAQSSYPMSKQITPDTQMVVEPLVAVTLAPNVKNDKVPNEDSQDIQIDASNLFEPNRFPGLDRVEDQSHVTYGLKTGIYMADGSSGDVFIGQSYRFDDKNNPFTTGSGLDQQSSDLVGKVSLNYKNAYKVDYRFQMDNEDLSSQRHEFDGSLSFANVTLGSQYLYAKGLEDTDVSETREQVRNYVSYKIDDQWRVMASARHDLGIDKGLRQAAAGLDYSGQCISATLSASRNLTDEASGDSGTEVFLRIGLKNLGEFETSGLSFNNSNE